MTSVPDGWQSRVVDVAAGEIRRYRRQRRMSAQQLADACSEYGLSLHRSVIANLESGRRPTLSLVEILVIARILGVPPIQLIFPAGYVDKVEVLPGVRVSTWDAAKWFTGEESPLVSPDDVSVRGRSQSPVALLREHDRLVEAHRVARAAAASALRASEDPASDRNQAFRTLANSEERHAREVERSVQACRNHMRSLGLTPPELPCSLVHVDEAQLDASCCSRGSDE